MLRLKTRAADRKNGGLRYQAAAPIRGLLSFPRESAFPWLVPWA